MMIKHNMKTPKSGVTFQDGEYVITGLRGEVEAKFGNDEALAKRVCAAMNADIERRNAEL